MRCHVWVFQGFLFKIKLLHYVLNSSPDGQSLPAAPQHGLHQEPGLGRRLQDILQRRLGQRGSLQRHRRQPGGCEALQAEPGVHGEESCQVTAVHLSNLAQNSEALFEIIFQSMYSTRIGTRASTFYPRARGSGPAGRCSRPLAPRGSLRLS